MLKGSGCKTQLVSLFLFTTGLTYMPPIGGGVPESNGTSNGKVTATVPRPYAKPVAPVAGPTGTATSTSTNPAKVRAGSDSDLGLLHGICYVAQGRVDRGTGIGQV